MAKTEALIVGGTGVILVWSAIQNVSALHVVGNLIRGKPTAPGPAGVSAAPAPGTSGGSVVPTGGGGNTANQALGRVMAAAYGWSTGPEWTALNNIVEAESGWDANAANPSSNARGIAQNINGWGPGYEPGNAAEQISWLLSYIKSRYGDPVAAWNFHVANGYY